MERYGFQILGRHAIPIFSNIRPERQNSSTTQVAQNKRGVRKRTCAVTQLTPMVASKCVNISILAKKHRKVDSRSDSLHTNEVAILILRMHQLPLE
jgi:hypothetical protein